MNCKLGSRCGLVAIALALCIATVSVDAAQKKPRRSSKSAPAKKSRAPKAKKAFSTGLSGSSAAVVEEIDKLMRTAWVDNEVSQSAVASDSEWVRRVYLDLVGHIPSLDETQKFLSDRSKTKRADLIDKLLAHPDFVRSWTTIWTNHAIGQQTPDRVSRVGMRKFFREAFARNRPWDKVVYDLISAEGHFEENGAVNFLLAQMTLDDEAVQATAKTARLFFGIQVQCTQCHQHPFNNFEQNQFWELNSFFRQARRRDVDKFDENSGRMVDDYSVLENNFNVEGGVFYEKRNALMKVAYPKYFGTPIETGRDVNRRLELARLATTFDKAKLADGERPLIADAMANRTWGHFFGYAFTRPLDDMGPHNLATHPGILETLSTEFVKSGFDVRQLMRWICNTEAYNLTSRFGDKNKIDNPGIGERTQFSHYYLKQLTAEQLYDSLLTATDAHKSGRSNWEKSQQQRRMWLQQFITAFGTDENDEATSFDGSIPQALMMMNGDLMKNAINAERGGFLYKILSDKGNDTTKIRKLYLAALSRAPIGRELKAAKTTIQRAKTPVEGYQDLYWALLNSNEFILVH